MSESDDEDPDLEDVTDFDYGLTDFDTPEITPQTQTKEQTTFQENDVDGDQKPDPA